MDRIWKSGASGTPPVAPAVPSVGFPTQGNPVAGVPATTPGAWWFHMITEELRNVILAAGILPDGSDVGQLLVALQTMFAPASGLSRTWQNFIGSRVANTAYQNTTGREIVVAIRADASTGVGRFIEVSSDATTWIPVGATGQADDGEGTCFPVPTNWYYRINGSVANITAWAELR